MARRSLLSFPPLLFRSLRLSFAAARILDAGSTRCSALWDYDRGGPAVSDASDPLFAPTPAFGAMDTALCNSCLATPLFEVMAFKCDGVTDRTGLVQIGANDYTRPVRRSTRFHHDMYDDSQLSTFASTFMHGDTPFENTKLRNRAYNDIATTTVHAATRFISSFAPETKLLSSLLETRKSGKSKRQAIGSGLRLMDLAVRRS